MSTPAWWLVLAALVSVIVAALAWGLLGRVTSTVTEPSLVMAAGPAGTPQMTSATGHRTSQLTLLVPADAVPSVRPGMRATFAAAGPQGAAPKEFGGRVRKVRIVSLHQGWPHGGAANIPGSVEAAVLTLAMSSPSSTKQSLPPTGVTGAAQIITSQRRPISLVVP